ncbi:uncharacterized protein LOC120002828 [Tripterygium wilfordii]|uniref:uncharacterized protein LOC120002828 n=1 Tax=Tripterygium wilfordii TaxID=458696 RepID=UPI0018F84090|nr:uncharacterized protein LOC120002828 [Tripterygium wilfordii]
MLVLEDKWEELKKEWELWNKLVRLGWDHKRDTVKARKDLWQARLQENSNYSKLHLFGLENKDELDIMFRDTFGIGAHAISPSTALDPIYDSRKRSRSMKASKPRKKKSTVMDVQLNDLLERLTSLLETHIAEQSKRLAEKAGRAAPTKG